MLFLGVKKVQGCPFKGTNPVASCCTPKCNILHLVSLCFSLFFQVEFFRKCPSCKRGDLFLVFLL